MSINTELFEFIKNSPSAYHTVASVKDALTQNGYTELYEGDEWHITDGKGYFVTKNGTSIIAFKARSGANGFMIAASHSDFPSFRCSQLFREAGIETDVAGFITVKPNTAITNIPGVFAAGDCTGRPYQIATAVGEGNTAAHSVVEYLSRVAKL